VFSGQETTVHSSDQCQLQCQFLLVTVIWVFVLFTAAGQQGILTPFRFFIPGIYRILITKIFFLLTLFFHHLLRLLRLPGSWFTVDWLTLFMFHQSNLEP